MKLFKQVRKYGAKLAAGVGGVTLGAAAMAQAATGPVDTIFASISLTTVAASVVGLGVVIIGIVMAFKGVDLGKRAVKKV